MTLIDSDKLWDEVHANEEEAAEAWNNRADERPGAYWGKLENGKILNCSACGAKYRNSGISEVMHKGESVYDYEEPRYCPHCGARMDEGADDNENC